MIGHIYHISYRSLAKVRSLIYIHNLVAKFVIPIGTTLFAVEASYFTQGCIYYYIYTYYYVTMVYILSLAVICLFLFDFNNNYAAAHTRFRVHSHISQVPCRYM